MNDIGIVAKPIDSEDWIVVAMRFEIGDDRKTYLAIKPKLPTSYRFTDMSYVNIWLLQHEHVCTVQQLTSVCSASSSYAFDRYFDGK